MLGGKPVILHVYEKVAAVLEEAYVATDDERIFNAVEAFGGKAVMTRTDHKSGTDRIEEAIEKIGGDWDVIVNVQGDEPFVAKSQLETICHCFDDPITQIATLGKVDQGGGGTVAAYMANRNIVTVDAGVPVLCMHAPMELVSKLDCYETMLACKAIYLA